MGSNQPQSQQQQQQQQQPVAQMIFESLTRCFNPINEGGMSCGGPNRQRNRNDAAAASSSAEHDDFRSSRFSQASSNSNTHTPSRKKRLSKASPSPTRASDRLELSGKEWDDVFSVTRKGSDHEDQQYHSQHRRRGQHHHHARSSPTQGKQAIETDLDYANVVARTKKAAHHRRTSSSKSVDPATLQEKSMKRKLEIFRCRDSTISDTSFPSNASSRRRSPSQPRTSATAAVAPRATRTEEELAFSDSDEEIANLTSKKRFACGMNMGGTNHNGKTTSVGGGNGHNFIEGPISSFARFFNLNPPPMAYGLCFATPVRTSSRENFADLSDDKLTADEFLQRHGRGNNSLDTPELETSIDGSVRDGTEDETITSTLYFDQKYEHVVQTRPPMPLFHSQLIETSESKTDELTKIVEERQRSGGDKGGRYTSGAPYGSQSPPKLITSKVNRRSSPSTSANNHSRSGTVFAKTNPSKSSPSGSKSSRSGGNSNRYSMSDSAPPSPMRLTVQSSSASTQSGDSSPGNNHCTIMTQNGVRRLRDPDILHSTAAEI